MDSSFSRESFLKAAGGKRKRKKKKNEERRTKKPMIESGAYVFRIRERKRQGQQHAGRESASRRETARSGR
jgi:hypothetical protein